MAAVCRTHRTKNCTTCKRRADSSANTDTMSSLFTDYTDFSSSYDTGSSYCAPDTSSSYDSSSSSSDSSSSSSCD